MPIPPRLLTATASLLFLLSLNVCASAAEEYGYTIITRQQHDPQIFTQGYIVDGDNFYESSGLYGRSFLVRYSKSNNADALPTKRLSLPRHIFAEGLTLFNDRLYLLSWREGQAWAFDKDSFEVLGSYRYSGEGWGLTHDGEVLILSDGSDTLRFYDSDFQLQGTLKVTLNGHPLTRLNELEYHKGVIWANQWYDKKLYAINRHDGEVAGYVDLRALHEEAAGPSSESVLNGIAYDADEDAFWVTGKNWRYQYLLRFTDSSSSSQ